MSRLGDAFSYDDLEIVSVEAGDRAVHVVSPRTLYEMKRNTVRPRGCDDAERLRQAFDLEG